DGRGERAAAHLSVCACDTAGIHLPLPLGGRLDRAVGQSLHAAQSGERLSRLPPRDAPCDTRGRRPAITHDPRKVGTGFRIKDHANFKKGTAMPEVYVHAVEGRTPEQKKALMKDITDAVVKNFGTPADAVVVTIVESQKINKAKAGVPFTER